MFPLSYGKVFFVSGGNSSGDLAGHSKAINSVDMTHNRPFYLLTASEDSNIQLIKGTPFKEKAEFKVSIFLGYSAGLGSYFQYGTQRMT